MTVTSNAQAAESTKRCKTIQISNFPSPLEGLSVFYMTSSSRLSASEEELQVCLPDIPPVKNSDSPRDR